MIYIFNGEDNIDIALMCLYYNVRKNSHLSSTDLFSQAFNPIMAISPNFKLIQDDNVILKRMCMHYTSLFSQQ